ncbi:MAG TPA: hypothetical protein PK685_03425 [archaeon]|jgi:rRNA maturation protein Rpf1|nr:hypothetical protein [archaeon]
MFITTSRKAEITEKKFCKYMGLFFSDIKHIPRGETSLKKLFERSAYLGYKQFLLISKNKENLILEVYVLKEDSYFLEKALEIKNLKTKLNLSLSKIKNTALTEKPNIEELFKTKETDNQIRILKTNNNFSFLLEEKETGFSFDLKKVKEL